MSLEKISGYTEKVGLMKMHFYSFFYTRDYNQDIYWDLFFKLKYILKKDL